MQESGQQSVSDVAREARTLAQSLKESVKKNEALDKEAELRRKNLRKQYLKLLLLYPNSKEAKDTETHIWMQTSYQIISVYKQRLAILDKKLFASPAQTGKNAARHDLGGGGHVEYRKTLSRFRQFLAEEEKFYVQLLVRFESQFGLAEARPALVRAEIISPEQEYVLPSDTGRSLFPEHVETIPVTAHERESRLATFTKILVCLGDIARYREQYNDGGGRPRAGHEEGQPRRAARGGRKGAHETVARPRNYNRARLIYEQARLLLPNDGNASHQLAILCSYQKDTFGSLLHYYRALCVRQPYDTASNNLDTVLKKALDQYRASKGARDADDDSQMVQKVRNDHFLESVVVLHGLWYLDSDERAARASKHARNVVVKFKSLIAEPALPTNLVSEVVIVAFSALWKMRMIRDQHIRASRRVIEPLVAMHILVMSSALFDTARLQLAEKIDDIQDKGDLAQQITAALRRILPAIRIVSKWLRSNMGYIEALESNSLSPDSFEETIKAFWNAYTAFLTSLSETFPLSKLPILKGPLEEDVDLTGFSPIKKGMLMQPAATDNGLAPGQDKVHPNEEYLMRISDLLRDAEQNVAHENAPISLTDGKFAYSTKQSTPIQMASALIPDSVQSNVIQEVLPSEPDIEDEDDNTTEISHDDVVRDAFNEALRDDPQAVMDYDDDEDDQIVWSPPKLHYTPLQNPSHALQVSPPSFPPVQPLPASTPTFVPPPTLPSTGTTAEDLLNNVLRKSEHSSFSHQRVPSSTPQSSLLFGSGSFNAPTKSIWSDTSSPIGPTRAAPLTIPQYGNLAPGHERTRTQSQSFSRSQPWLSQGLTNTQDSIYSGVGNISTALPVGHLGFSQLAGHQDMSLSGTQDFFQVASAPAQIFYDSQFPQPPMPPMHNHQDSHVHGYGSQSADPFLHYNSQRNSGFAGVTPSVPSINQSIWNT